MSTKYRGDAEHKLAVIVTYYKAVMVGPGWDEMHGRHFHSDDMIPWFLDDAQGFYFRLGWTTQW